MDSRVDPKLNSPPQQQQSPLAHERPPWLVTTTSSTPNLHLLIICSSYVRRIYVSNAYPDTKSPPNSYRDAAWATFQYSVLVSSHQLRMSPPNCISRIANMDTERRELSPDTFPTRRPLRLPSSSSAPTPHLIDRNKRHPQNARSWAMMPRLHAPPLSTDFATVVPVIPFLWSRSHPENKEAVAS